MTKTIEQITRELSAPFHPFEVKVRNQSGTELHYIDARAVQDRLDEVLGIDNWEVSYYTKEVTVTVSKKNYETKQTETSSQTQVRTFCKLSLNLGGKIVTKEDAAGDSNVEAEKGAVSDALKRAAVCFGINRCMYDKSVLRDYKRYYSLYMNMEAGEGNELIAELKKLGTRAELEEWRKNNYLLLTQHLHKDKIFDAYKIHFKEAK